MDDGKEGMSVVKIALGIIILLVLVGVVFAIVRLGTSKVNSAQNDLADNMDSAELMQYSRYDNAEVVGSDVLTAVKNYQNSNIKIFVANKEGNGGNAYDVTQLAGGTALGSVYSYGYMGVSGSADTAPVLASNGTFEADIIPDNVANEAFNLDFSPLSNKNNRAQYVRQGGRYWGYLVYDQNTGTLAGLLFVQIK